MLRRFSEELVEDREFEIGGELFKFRYPHWEEGAKLFDEELTPETNGTAPKEDEPAVFSFRADTEYALQRIPMFLDPENDSHKRFRALAARKTDPVPRYQFVQLYRWLVQVTSGLPTTPPSEQSAGGGEDDTQSSERSSSPEATPTA
jgi:hypothetical protein